MDRKAIQFYGSLGVLLLALLIYADYRGGKYLEVKMEGAMERWVYSNARAEYARPLPPATRPVGEDTADEDSVTDCGSDTGLD